MTRYERIRELRRKIENLASEARALKCEFEGEGNPEHGFLESAEDCLDDASNRLLVAAGD